ncbi:hypothetical protein GCM10008018_16120 [Paenibacillus marchantiophytorum]|uniref:Methyltransferase FkbM domain-containing protein n=1 Tax=Paenibacillus marchantiophytorum TaxID=1619310 RepID=A0ABQ2BU88_9BACL|nr:hypothetical protein [Paenibacillus marchantiophytorum]GGI46238.1 hypothetical protein GCM10008018_16120 [Paenibacillus marchantiophytorum]
MESLMFLQRINIALSRGAATSQLRNIDETDPSSWEFSAFSQNGEDGIIDYLARKIINPNYYFIEVGASEGLENNSSWLALGRKYEGTMYEGSLDAVSRLKEHILPMALGVEAYSLFVNLENTEEIISRSLYKNPDVISLDIDGNDYYIVKKMLEDGLRPKIFVVEYNSAFGPDNSMTIEYDKDFVMDFNSYENYLYFGVSITAWRKLFNENGYKFVTVERRGVNAFFVNPQYFEATFLENIKGACFAENFYQFQKYGTTWLGQFEFIKDKSLYTVIK